MTIGRPGELERKIRWQVVRSKRGELWGVWCGICKWWKGAGGKAEAVEEVRKHKERHLKEQEFMEASGLGGIAKGRVG